MNKPKLSSYEKSRDVNTLEQRRMTVYNATVNTRQSAYNRYSASVLPQLKMATGSTTHANAKLEQKPMPSKIPAEHVQVVRLVGEHTQQQEQERNERFVSAQDAINEAYTSQGDSHEYKLAA